MAKTNSQVRRSVREVWPPSTPLMKCSCGSRRSMSSSTSAPSRMAAPMVPPASQAPAPAAREALMPGMMSENEQAASITPAPKPNMVSCVRSEMRCDSITGTVPRAVASAATLPPIRAASTTGWPAIHCQTCSEPTSPPSTTMARPSHCRQCNPGVRGLDGRPLGNAALSGEGGGVCMASPGVEVRGGRLSSL
jgi:hypothetical protein